MKKLNTYIQEAIVKGHISKKTQNYNYTPQTKKELENIIKQKYSSEGFECDLNDIDVSKITDMSNIFYGTKFNGDVSKWNVSNVENMNGMFFESDFDGDVSNWDVSNVKTMLSMFEESEFSGKNDGISKWKLNKDCKFDEMLSNTPYDDSGKSPQWYKDYMSSLY